jgi:hypothetical protein
MPATTDTATIDYPAAATLRSVALRVRFTGMKVFRARLWLACATMHMAVFIAGCAVEVELEMALAASPSSTS